MNDKIKNIIKKLIDETEKLKITNDKIQEKLESGSPVETKTEKKINELTSLVIGFQEQLATEFNLTDEDIFEINKKNIQRERERERERESKKSKKKAKTGFAREISDPPTTGITK